ncbi:hypothetical protein PI95_031740 [Hassallia byssoidea VB512170]|uniref:Uncharacterized protein n=1 Tax=Hassallia byssoidea VB512170 TaxID=1304833 RepID=A0A846HHF7_9CYAN|nr:hypothetical protein [Hassalia byssoidea]NEU76947.1 hypothetical protein [Hassalia byssoidea VB512170]
MTLNPDSWQFKWYQRFQAERPTPDTYKPISSIEVPVVFDSSLIAVLATSNTAPTTWITAGWLNQRIPSGIINQIYPDADFVQNRRIILGRVTLLELPKITSNFSINYVVPRWFVDINLTFWQYTEETASVSSLDSLEEIKDILSNIQKVLDRIRRE